MLMSDFVHLSKWCRGSMSENWPINKLPVLCHTSLAFVCSVVHGSITSPQHQPLLSRLCYLGEDNTMVWCFPLHAAKGRSPCPRLIFIPNEIYQVSCCSTTLALSFLHCAQSRRNWLPSQTTRSWWWSCRFWQISPHSCSLSSWNLLSQV